MFCKKCGKEIEDKAILCVHCGTPVKETKPVYKKWWFWVVCVLVIGIIGGAAGTDDGGETSSASQKSDVSSTISQQASSITEDEFSAECPIEVSASIGDNIIGYPELSCNIENNTDKEIAAEQLYFEGRDVYGDDVNTIFTTKKIQTDNPINPNGSKTVSYQFLDKTVKSGDLYVYSVYFSDGTEWGDKDASTSKIKKRGMKISVES